MICLHKVYTSVCVGILRWSADLLYAITLIVQPILLRLCISWTT